MDISSRLGPQKQTPNNIPAGKLNMESLAMLEYSSVLPNHQEVVHQGNYTQPFSNPQLQRSSRDQIALPSIRQAVPEISIGSARPETLSYPPDRVPYSPAGNRSLVDLLESNPVDACHKRRRVSVQEVGISEPGYCAIPSIYLNSHQARAHTITTSPTELSQSGVFQSNSWGSLPWKVSHQASTFAALRSPSTSESSTNEFRPTLPSLASLTLEPGGTNSQGHSAWSDQALANIWPNEQTNPQNSRSSFSGPIPVPSNTQQSEYFSFQSSRGQPSFGSRRHSQLQISSGPVLASQSFFTDRPEHSEIGGMDATRHRKRRGNLPKETTDKLRAWFVAHLHHPYPTEDQKLELMKQTRLRMNQISNWFINARRRQLPAMINNAQMECENPSLEVSKTTPRITEVCEPGKQSEGLTLSLENSSDGSYEDDVDSPKQRNSSDSSIVPV